jgi:hypothetical protein
VLLEARRAQLEGCQCSARASIPIEGHYLKPPEVGPKPHTVESAVGSLRLGAHVLTAERALLVVRPPHDSESDFNQTSIGSLDTAQAFLR